MRDRQTDRDRRAVVAYRVLSRGVLQAAVVGSPLVLLLLNVDRGLVGGEEGGGPVQVLVEVVLSLVGNLGIRENVTNHVIKYARFCTLWTWT